MRIPELLAPAGNMEKARMAIYYGADAIYLAGKQYGMRASAGNFTLDELEEITKLAHRSGVKVYVTVNTFPHNREIIGLDKYLTKLEQIGVDGLIIADPGVLRLAKQTGITTPLHLSTQANTVNWQSALFWQEQGLARIVMARELSCQDIAEIKRNVDVEIEVFVHGAMCMAYSGRCLLSNVLTGRDANRGACAQSCRWRYQVVEENRPGEYFPIWEEEEGTYLFNSKDLCLLTELPTLIDIGVDSLKIEGRMKSAYYVATIVRAYRTALDLYASDSQNYRLPDDILAEVEKVSHRPYYTGFFRQREAGIYQDSSAYIQGYDFVGVVVGYSEKERLAEVEVRNKLTVGDQVEIMQPRAENVRAEVTEIRDARDGQNLPSAHANYTVLIPLPPVRPHSILRVERQGRIRSRDQNEQIRQEE